MTSNKELSNSVRQTTHCWLGPCHVTGDLEVARANSCKLRGVAPEKFEFQRQSASCVILNEWTFVPMLVTNVLWPFGCTYLTQWLQESSGSRWPSKMSSENHLKPRHFHLTALNYHRRGWMVSSTNDPSGTDTHARSRLRANPLSSP